MPVPELRKEVGSLQSQTLFFMPFFWHHHTHQVTLVRSNAKSRSRLTVRICEQLVQSCVGNTMRSSPVFSSATVSCDRCKSMLTLFALVDASYATRSCPRRTRAQGSPVRPNVKTCAHAHSNLSAGLPQVVFSGHEQSREPARPHPQTELVTTQIQTSRVVVAIDLLASVSLHYTSQVVPGSLVLSCWRARRSGASC